MPVARLVPFTRRHVDALTDGFNSGAAAATTFWRMPVSYARAAGRFELQGRLRPKPHRFAILDAGRFVGLCALFPATYSGRTLVIAIFDPKARGKGIGTFAVQALCDFGFRKLKTHRIELGVYTHNHRAIAVYEKCGFKREALLRRDVYNDGVWQNSLWMSLLRDEWRARRKLPGGRR